MPNCPLCGNSEIIEIINTSDFSNTGETFTISDCTKCSFRFTSNPPLISDCGKYYQNENYISHSDTKKGLIAWLYHKVRNIMLKRKYKLVARISSNKNVLDIGSGTGYFLDYLKTKGYHVHGVELSDNARAYSIQSFNLNVDKSIDDINTDMTFDYITLWHVLEHLYEPDSYMHKFKELLSEDGTLIIALPNFDSYDGKKYEKYWAAYDVPRHLWHFTPKTFEKFASKNGFSIIEKQIMPFDPFYNAMLSEKYMKRNLSFVRGFISGLIALIKGIKSTENASSIIYILKPNHKKLIS